MERKTKHRILGVLVLAGLVIILLPFFQGGSESSDVALTQAPPFPDQSMQVSVNNQQSADNTNQQSTSDLSAQSDKGSADTAISTPNSQSTTVPVKTIAAPTANNLSQENENKITKQVSATSVGNDLSANLKSSDQPDETINLNQQANVENVKEPVIDATAAQPKKIATTTNVDHQNVSTNEDDSQQGLDPNPPKSAKPVVSEAKKAITEKSHKVALKKSAAVKVASKSKSTAKIAVKSSNNNTVQTANNHLKAGEVVSYASLIGAVEQNAKKSEPPANKETLSKLTNTSFAIQVGTFKNKTNALRLVNQLREKGYKSFIQQTKLASGTTSTRVLVGPEHKQASAKELVARIKDDFKLSAVVVTYKPLAL